MKTLYMEVHIEGKITLYIENPLHVAGKNPSYRYM